METFASDSDFIHEEYVDLRMLNYLSKNKRNLI